MCILDKARIRNASPALHMAHDEHRECFAQYRCRGAAVHYYSVIDGALYYIQFDAHHREQVKRSHMGASYRRRSCCFWR